MAATDYHSCEQAGEHQINTRHPRSECPARNAWFINEEGEVYEYGMAVQAGDFPNDFHTAYASELEARAAAENPGRTYQPTSEEFSAAVVDMRREILECMGTAISSRSTRMPMTVSSFSELHDYIDANTLAGFCGPEKEGDVDRSEWDTDQINRVQDVVHRWLASGNAYVDRVLMPARVTNTNCLVGVRCPECGYEEEIEVAVTKWATIQDNGADSSGGDTEYEDSNPARCGECGHEGTYGEFLIATQQLQARPNHVWLSLGEFRRRTAHLPDETPMTADGQGLPDAGASWYNMELDDSSIPKIWPPLDGPPSIILGLKDDFDTRQW